MLLHIPVVGGLLREVLAARFTRVLGTLLVNGVPLIGGTWRGARCGGQHGRGRGDRARPPPVRAMAAGCPASLSESGVFPPRTIHLLRLGEENAQLGPIALRAAAIHEERTRLATQRLVSLLVPAITILMGLAVAGIVASLMTAMLSLNDLAGGG